MLDYTSWVESFPKGLSEDILNDLACCAAMHAGEVGPEMVRLLRKREYKTFLERDWISYGSEAPDIFPDCDPTGESLRAHNRKVTELRFARQALAFFQKYEELDVGIDKRAEALKSYFTFERACRETNGLFAARSQGVICLTARSEWILANAKRRISQVLGAAPQLDQLKLRFGPGATVKIKKSEASTVRKLGMRLDCSEELIPTLPIVLGELPMLAEYHGTTYIKNMWTGVKTVLPEKVKTFSYDPIIHEEWVQVPVEVTQGILSFVPKNWKTYRVVEKQPSLNSMVQLAIGDEMTVRCKSSGLDLTDQERNRHAAKIGSLTGASATLDLKGASDTESYSVVDEFLPVDWFELLSSCRVGRIEDPRDESPDGASLGLEKFSAMGNGYTFPLESLIFWALTHACLAYHESVDEGVVGRRQIEVYGDDIICPVEIVSLVHEALHVFGFILNTEKSFWQGPFRESCGADFYAGTDIRPVFAKENLSPAVLFTLHNGLRARGMHELASKCVQRIAPELRLYGPVGYGDGVLHAEAWPRTRKSAHLANGFEGSIFRSFQRVSKRDYRPSTRDGEELLASYQAYSRATEELVPAAVNLKLGSFETFRRLQKVRKEGPNGPTYVRFNLDEPFSVRAPSDKLPLAKAVQFGEIVRKDDGPELVKAPTFPGFQGVKLVSNYILDHGA